MKNNNLIFFTIILFVTLSCTLKSKPNDSVVLDKTELKKEMKYLRTLDDSFKITGNYKFMKLSLKKTNELLEKFPNYKGLTQWKVFLLEMYGDSIM
jgi:hypothetical protein